MYIRKKTLTLGWKKARHTIHGVMFPEQIYDVNTIEYFTEAILLSCLFGKTKKEKHTFSLKLP